MHHCTQGGLTAKAVGYGHRAGEMANRRGAMTEALSHFNKALNYLQASPRARSEISKNSGCSSRGAGCWLRLADGRRRRWVRHILELASYSGSSKASHELEQITALNGLWVFHHNRAELDAADEAAGELQRLAERRQGAAVLMLAHRASRNEPNVPGRVQGRT